MMKVKTTLLYRKSMSGFKTEVNVKDGIVTLQGEATSLAQKDLATEYAMDVEGLKSVNYVDDRVEDREKDTRDIG